MGQSIDWSLISNIVVALMAVYAAALSTWTFIIQLRAAKPQVTIKMEFESFQQRRDEYGQDVQKPLGDLSDQGRDWVRVDALSIYALNTGQQEVILTRWGVMLSNKKILFSQDIQGNQAILAPSRRFEGQINLKTLTASMPRGWLLRWSIGLIGFYQDALGNTYTSKKTKLSTTAQHILFPPT